MQQLDIWLFSMDFQGLEDFTAADFRQAMSVDRDDWNNEILSRDELFIRLSYRIPEEMIAICDLTLSALWHSPEHWEMNPDPTDRAGTRRAGDRPSS